MKNVVASATPSSSKLISKKTQIFFIIYQIERAQIGKRCEKNVECSEETTFAMCTNHTCSCKPDFILHNGTCQSLVGKFIWMFFCVF